MLLLNSQNITKIILLLKYTSYLIKSRKPMIIKSSIIFKLAITIHFYCRTFCFVYIYTTIYLSILILMSNYNVSNFLLLLTILPWEWFYTHLHKSLHFCLISGVKLNVQVKVVVVKQFSKVVVPIYSPSSKIREFHLFYL